MVEIMVGVLIGMVSAIVMMQVLSLSEGQKRAATGGSDAQTSGAIALQTLQRDIREAGYELGFGSLGTTPIGCKLTIALPASGATVTLNSLAPVTINHPDLAATGPDPGTDTLLVVAGSGNYAPDGDAILGGISPNYAIRSNMAFLVGDRVIASSPHDPNAVCGVTLNLDRVATAPSGYSFNVGVANFVPGSKVLYNLGPSPIIRAYAVRGGKLTVCDYTANDCGAAANANNAGVWVPIADGIVSLRAEYGRDVLAASPPPPGLSNYSANTFDQTTPTTACGWLRVPVVRAVLVARAGQMERQVVTFTQRNVDNQTPNAPTVPNAPTWAGDATAPLVSSLGVLGPDAADDEPWKHYRYKAFETVVPIRTLTYAKPSC